MIEEYFVAVYYNGNYAVIEQEESSYENCLKFIQVWAEDTLDGEEGKEGYNQIAQLDRHFVYWKIEKRFRLKEVK